MFSHKPVKKPNPRENASSISIIVWWWTVELFTKGFHKVLGEEDLYEPLKSDKSSKLGNQLEARWLSECQNAKKKNCKPSLLKTIVQTFFLEFLFLGILSMICEVGLNLATPLILGSFLGYFKPGTTTTYESALLFAAGISLSQLLRAIVFSQFFYGTSHVGGKIQIAVSSIIYTKALKLSKAALGETEAGKIINLVANDVNRFVSVSFFLHYTWSAPLLSLIVGIILYNRAGFPGLIGISTILLVIPMQAYFGKLSSKYRLQTSLKTDERLRLMNEIISNVQLIKMYSWEKSFCTLLEDLRHKDKTDFSNYAVQFNDFSATWNPSERVTLQNINAQINKGELCMLIGLVAAGKSSFLSAILREMCNISGELKLDGKISYANQEAWIFGASVRQNILFGETFDSYKYQTVIKSCALLKDFELLSQGDQTIVGEKGRSLSGGQKARINLARAVYKQADIYLLDDPLSAVDVHVGKYLFEECFQRYLKGKTRILATHQLHFIKNVDSIILLDKGRTWKYKNYLELLKSHPEYNNLITSEKVMDVQDQSVTEKFSLDNQISRKNSEVRELCITKSLSIEYLKENLKDNCSSSFVDREVIEDTEENADLQKLLLDRGVSASGNSDNRDIKSIDNEKKTTPEITLEKTSRGIIKENLILKYFISGVNIFVFSTMSFLFIFTLVTVSFHDYFLPVFIYSQERTFNDKINISDSTIGNIEIKSKNFYITTYTIVILSILAVGLARSFVFYAICMRCNQRLHNHMFRSLIRASLRFFDKNPSGKIINRFSKDIAAIDELLPNAIMEATQNILGLLGALTLMFIVNPLLLAPIVVIVLIFYWIRKIYLKTSKSLKRLEAMTRSPVFTHLNTTLSGLETIRVNKAQCILKAEFNNLQDAHTSSWYMLLTTLIAYRFALEFFTFTYTTLVIYSFLQLSDNFSDSQVGLIITQLLSTIVCINWGMEQAAEVSNQSIAVERIFEYIRISPEPNLQDKGPVTEKIEEKDLIAKLPRDWPNRGRIEFKNVNLRYSEEDPVVLNDLSMIINPTEKVGIVGRTGAGKSSLIAALFRMAIIDGTIEIHGIDTNTVVLEDLRKQFTIIPQQPVLFSNTLRRNLDPFNEYPDELLWKALEQVELKERIASTENGLDHRGLNYSFGQCQLICLARAILRNNRIIILDEATANVDPKTDACIQKTIKSKFEQCTVLTIAHRLNTIIDSDKIIVMDKGRIVEYDHPYKLLQNENGKFTSLVKETGPSMHEQLRDVAHNSYKNRSNNV